MNIGGFVESDMLTNVSHAVGSCLIDKVRILSRCAQER